MTATKMNTRFHIQCRERSKRNPFSTSIDIFLLLLIVLFFPTKMRNKLKWNKKSDRFVQVTSEILRKIHRRALYLYSINEREIIFFIIKGFMTRKHNFDISNFHIKHDISNSENQFESISRLIIWDNFLNSRLFSLLSYRKYYTQKQKKRLWNGGPSTL